MDSRSYSYTYSQWKSYPPTPTPGLCNFGPCGGCPGNADCTRRWVSGDCWEYDWFQGDDCYIDSSCTCDGANACFSCGFSDPTYGRACGQVVWEGWVSQRNANECYGRLEDVAGNNAKCRGDYQCLEQLAKCGGPSGLSASYDEGIGWSTCRRPELTGNIRIINPTDTCDVPGRAPDQEDYYDQQFANAAAWAFRLYYAGTTNRIPLDGGACDVLTHTDSSRGLYGCYVKRDLINPPGNPGGFFANADFQLNSFTARGQRYVVKCPTGGKYPNLSLKRNARDLESSVGPGVIQKDFKVAIYVTPPWIQVTGDVHSNKRIRAPGGP